MHPSVQERQGFTFVEILIGITISAIIMVGVAIFVGSGVENAFKIRKGLEENHASADFDATLGNIVSFGGQLLYTGSFSAPYGSGFVMKNPNLPIPLVIVATKTLTGICDAYSGITDDPGVATQLSILETYAPGGAKSATGYLVDPEDHVIRDSATNAVVLWTGNPGSAGGDGSAWTATELRFPSSITNVGSGKYLVADSGNDRILLFDGATATTFLGTDSGIRQPHEIVTDGQDIRIAESGRIFGILGNPTADGSAFSGSFDSDAGFSFDTVKITLQWGRAPSSDVHDYAFDFTPTNTTGSVSANVATLSFSGATYSYATGDLVQVSAKNIPLAATANGAYSSSVQYFLAGAEKYRRDFPYFIAGDHDPLTLSDNSYEITATGSVFPTNLSFSGGLFSFEDLHDFSNLPKVAAIAKETRSSRMIENLTTVSDGKTLTLRFVEYVRYDCLGGSHVKRERVFKIPLR